MFLDVIKLRACLESIIIPVQLPHPANGDESISLLRWMTRSQMDVRVPMTDVTQIAFEVAYVHGVKANLSKKTLSANGMYYKLYARW